jgi:hypothetical protein
MAELDRRRHCQLLPVHDDEGRPAMRQCLSHGAGQLAGVLDAAKAATSSWRAPIHSIPSLLAQALGDDVERVADHAKTADACGRESIHHELRYVRPCHARPLLRLLRSFLID